jgi:HTH-type transcriptional regulator / antitoxin HigA
MKPRLLKTEKEYEKGLARIDQLMSAKADTPEMDELEFWVLLVEAYEDKHYPMDPPDPIEAILFRMDQEGLHPADLVPYIGSKSKVSEVLNGKRSLSLTMIRKLSTGLGIPTEILLQKQSVIRKSRTKPRPKHLSHLHR